MNTFSIKKSALWALLFPVLWAVYCVVVILQKVSFEPLATFGGVAVGCLFLWLGGFLLLLAARGRTFSLRLLLGLGLFLFLLDVAAKTAVLHLLAPDGALRLAGDWLAIRFAPNHSNSVLLNLLGIRLDARWFEGLLKLVVAGAVAGILGWYARGQAAFLADGRIRLAAMLGAAAVASSTLDTFLYGYVLDFISFAGLVAFDLKDLYLMFAIGLFVIAFLELEGADKNKPPADAPKETK